MAFKGELSVDGRNVADFSLKERAKLISYIPAKLDIYDSFINMEEFVLLGRFVLPVVKTEGVSATNTMYYFQEVYSIDYCLLTID